MILSDWTIEERLSLPLTDQRRLSIEPYDERYLQGASYDVHLGDAINYQTKDIPLTGENGFLLPPRGACLAVLQERVVTPTDCVCRLEGVSSIGRAFVIVHCTAGWGDPGYIGNFTVEIVNHHPINFFALSAGMRIGQLTWLQLDRPANRVYRGRYQHDRTVQGPKEAGRP